MSIIDHYVIMHSFLQYEWRFSTVENMEEAMILVTANQIKSEIIGDWLYCFANDLVGVQLLSIGFWYCRKHNAYVYSGDEKQPLAYNETLDEIRARLGNRQLKIA
jgi:hypothetical protein